MKYKNIILTGIFFIILIFIFTFPLIINITTHIPGFSQSSEIYQSIWANWRIRYSLFNNLDLFKTPLIGYPYSVDLYSSGYFSYLSFGIYMALNFLLKPVLSHNIQILINLVLSSLFTYLLVYKLTKKKSSAVLGSVIFTFCPYQFVRIWQHFGLTYNWLLPMILYCLILLKENKTVKRQFAFFVSLILLYSFDYHLMFFGSWIILLFFVYILFFCWRRKIKNLNLIKEDVKSLWRFFLPLIFLFLIMFFQFFPLISNFVGHSSNTLADSHNFYNRSFEDLFSQSAKPLSYILPSTEHPVFGKFTSRFVDSFLWGKGYTEPQIYLGWVGIILAFIIFRKWRKSRKSKETAMTENDSFYIGYFIFLAFFAWLLSQPPWWNFGLFKIYMPSFFIYKILPMIRAYCRFGVLVVLAVSVLAGYGLRSILESINNKKIKKLAVFLIISLAMFEFFNWPPFKVLDVSKAPEVYGWLNKQDKDIVIAEYPIDTKADRGLYLFYQVFHQKKMINATVPGSFANKIANEITKLSEYKTAQILSGLGVKYVVVHYDYYKDTGLLEWVKELEDISNNSGIRLVKRFPAKKKDVNKLYEQAAVDVYSTDIIDVYEVVAQPVVIKNVLNIKEDI